MGLWRYFSSIVTVPFFWNFIVYISVKKICLERIAEKANKREEFIVKKRIFAILIVSVLILSSFVGCGSSKNSAEFDAKSSPAVTQSQDFSNYDLAMTVDGENGNYAGVEAPQEAKTDEVDATSIAGSGSTVDTINSAILSERKMIRSANISIEVDNFDEARNSINTIINGIGIVQESNVVTDKVYVDGEYKPLKSGTIVLRVYKEKFDSVFNNLKGIGDVTNEIINGQDVTDRFIDTESRLRLLKLEQERLETYLAKLDDLDKIFRTESRLTEIRYEIESLTVNLNKMSDLVELSTITLSMREKNPYEDKKPVKETYWQRLSENLKSSFEGVVSFLGEFFIFIIAAIPVLIMLGLFGLLVLFIYRKIKKRSRIAAESMRINPRTPVRRDEVQEEKKEE